MTAALKVLDEIREAIREIPECAHVHGNTQSACSACLRQIRALPYPEDVMLQARESIALLERVVREVAAAECELERRGGCPQPYFEDCWPCRVRRELGEEGR